MIMVFIMDWYEGFEIAMAVSLNRRWFELYQSKLWVIRPFYKDGSTGRMASS